MHIRNRRRLEFVIETFLTHMQTEGWSPRTIETYRGQLSFWLDFLASRPDVTHLTGVTPDLLRDYQLQLSTHARPLATSTRSLRLCAVRSFFRWLVRAGRLASDPSAGLRLPRRRDILPRAVLTRREIIRLIAAPDTATPLGLRDRAMLELLYGSGIRNAELRALRTEDVELDRCLLRIHTGKNGLDRIVPIGSGAATWIARYLAEARPILTARSSLDDADSVLFLSKTGQPLRTLGAIYPVKKYARMARIRKPVTPHTLRHTFATHLLAGRADIRFIQAMLGHASVATTQIYTRVEIGDLRRVHRRCHPRERMAS